MIARSSGNSWNVACSDISDTYLIDECLDVAQCQSIGHLIENNDEFIMLCGSLNDKDQACNIISIPRCSIRKMYVLKPKEIGLVGLDMGDIVDD